MILPGEWHRNAVTDALIRQAKEAKKQKHDRMVASVSKRLLGSKTPEKVEEAYGGTGSLHLGPIRKSNTLSVTYNSFGKKIKTVMKEGLLDKRTSSPEELAQKHGVSLEHINTQVEKGIKVEQEHTSNLDVAREIALDHLSEDPNYYFKLKKMEESVDPKKLRYNKYHNKFVKRHGNLFWNPDKVSANTKVDEAKHTLYKIHGVSQTYEPQTEKWSVDHTEHEVLAKSRKHALNKAVKKLQAIHPHHKEHEATIMEDVQQNDQERANEGVEQLDELSKGTLKNYINKAYPSQYDLEHRGDYGLSKKTKRLQKNRRVGIKQAWRKGSALYFTNKIDIRGKDSVKEAQQNDQVTIHYGAHTKEPHRVTRVHPDGEVTIQPEKKRGRENRYPQGELKVAQSDLHPMNESDRPLHKYTNDELEAAIKQHSDSASELRRFDRKSHAAHQHIKHAYAANEILKSRKRAARGINELHDEPDRIGAGMRGISGTEGMSMTEEPRKTLKVSKAEWDHHTRHSTAQYDTDGKPWIVKTDPSGAAIRIPVSITEEYPHRQTLRAVLKEAFPPKTEKPDTKTDSKMAKTVKGVVKKNTTTSDSSDTAVSIGKTKDKFEPDPVLTPVLSIANMPGGSVR